MKLLVIADLHLISPEHSMKEIADRRRKYASDWTSLKGMISLAQKEKPDLIISIGDIVDWYDAENRDYAIDVMQKFDVPWVMTPGNHDFETYRYNCQDGMVLMQARDGFAKASTGWKDRGVEYGNRIIDTGHGKLILLNSAFSDIEPGTEKWLKNNLDGNSRNILFTHVPPDTPESRQFILSIEKHRNMMKYVQSGAPWLFDKCLKKHIGRIFCGHLHFPGEFNIGETAITLLGIGTAVMVEV